MSEEFTETWWAELLTRGEPARNFNQATKVWSDMAVRAVVFHATESLRAEIEAMRNPWVSLDEMVSPPFSEPVDGYHPDWVDEDFNPDGIRECFWTGSEDEPHWFCAAWLDYQDCYETVENQPPTHWRKRPAPPPSL